MRREGHEAIRAVLAPLSDDDLVVLIASGRTNVSSTGCPTSRIQVAGRRVFVKKIPLSAVEMARQLSTANVFDLPMVHHYGIDSQTFGAWRELAVWEATTRLVLAGESPAFPLLHYKRILPCAPTPGVPQDRVEAFTSYWNGSQPIRNRLVATGGARHELVLFLEFIPHKLADWTHPEVSDPSGWAALVDTGWPALRALRKHGITHFDAHWENVLTDGEQVYFADMGLAIADAFEMTAEERAFRAAHEATYDYALYARGILGARLRLGRMPSGFERYEPLATRMFHFMRAVADDKSTPYPAAELQQLVEKVLP